MCLYTSGVGTQNTLYWNRVYDPVLFENELVQRWMVLEMFLKKLSWAMIIQTLFWIWSKLSISEKFTETELLLTPIY